MSGVAWPETFSPEEVQRARSLVRPQPAPKETGTEPAWPLALDRHVHRAAGSYEELPLVDRLLAADMLARDEAGREKYGVPLTWDCGRDLLVDAYQEALDLVVYLRAVEQIAQKDERLRNRRGFIDQRMTRAIELARDLRLLIAIRDGEAGS